jgi:hypothetical protein
MIGMSLGYNHHVASTATQHCCMHALLIHASCACWLWLRSMLCNRVTVEQHCAISAVCLLATLMPGALG